MLNWKFFVFFSISMHQKDVLVVFEVLQIKNILEDLWRILACSLLSIHWWMRHTQNFGVNNTCPRLGQTRYAQSFGTDKTRPKFWEIWDTPKVMGNMRHAPNFLEIKDRPKICGNTRHAQNLAIKYIRKTWQKLSRAYSVPSHMPSLPLSI